jgi:phosphotriesterase-related protein
MAKVETVTGPIDPDELGVTLIHEHFCGRDEAMVRQWPHLFDEQSDYDEGVEAARGVLGHGVKTVVDPSVMFLGRDVDFMRRIAEESGLQIVPSTGIYTYDALPHYLQNRDSDFIASCFVHDIEEGIQGTEIKAAFLKCAADEAGVNENIEKIHRAAARASVQTGAPIMAHSRPASNTGPRQVEIFLEEGVAPEKVQIAHTGDTDDLDYIEKLLDAGVYIGMDRFGLDIFLPGEKRNATVTELLKRGYAERMFLSQDAVVGFDWFPPEVIEQMLEAGLAKNWTMTKIFEEDIPALQEAGMTDEQLDTMLVENPKRWLAQR